MLRSKAHWGYSPAFLAHFAPGLVVRPAVLAHGDCVVAARGRHLYGYAMRRRARLADLFVAPEAMGRGVGGALLARLRRHARAAGQRTLTLEADPFAAGFYRRCGARVVGWSRSPWPGEPGRRLPRMRLATGRR
ncbi:GNAT family N-acetyltransferase [Stella sp.]|uniref:GNAT family N-acetyltransferase n=1 Tax=Stella sp. TaxID=2912054 RepID=UPI0035B1D389